MTKVQAVQMQLDVLSDWIAELGQNFDNDLNRVVPFEYTAKLAAALKLHGIDDPHTAWTVFTARAEARFQTCAIGFRPRASTTPDTRIGPDPI